MSDFDSRARKAADAVRQQFAENTPHLEKGIRRAQRSPARVAIPSAVAAAAVIIAGVAVTLPRSGDGGTASAEGAAFALPGPLQPFDTCDSVLQYFKDQAPTYLIERAGSVTTTDSGGAAERTTAVPQQGRATDSSGTSTESGVSRQSTPRQTFKKQELMSLTS